MERDGNTIGNEPRRQDSETDPSKGDRQHRQERLADQEIREGLDDVTTAREDQADEAEAGEGTSARDATAAEGIKPATDERLDQSDPERASGS